MQSDMETDRLPVLNVPKLPQNRVYAVLGRLHHAQVCDSGEVSLMRFSQPAQLPIGS